MRLNLGAAGLIGAASALQRSRQLLRLHDGLSAHTALAWEELFGEDVPCAAARSIGDMFKDPQLAAQGLVAHDQRPERRSATSPARCWNAPTLAQHGDRISEAATWLGLIGPAEMPAEAIACCGCLAGLPAYRLRIRLAIRPVARAIST